MGSVVDTARIREIVEEKEAHLTEEEIYLNGVKEEIISEFLKLAETIDYTSPLALFSLFHYLMKNGYFHYRLSKENRYLIEDNSCLLSVGAFNNHGACRHKNALFAEILKKYYEEVAVYIGAYERKNEELIPHMITLLKRHGIMYYFDCERGCCLEYLNGELKGAMGINFIGSTKEDLITFSNYLIGLEPLSLEESGSLEKINCVLQSYRKELQNYEEYIKMFYEKSQGLLETLEKTYKKAA